MKIYAIRVDYLSVPAYLSRGSTHGRSSKDKPDFWSDRERAEQVAAQCGGKVEEWEAGPQTDSRPLHGLSALSNRSGK